MDRAKMAEMLGASPDGAFVVTDIQVMKWGNELTFNGLYAPAAGLAIPFELIVKDCRDIQWRVYAHLRYPEDQTLPVAALVNVRLGAENHRKPLHLLTDFFGLTTSYGTLELRKKV